MTRQQWVLAFLITICAVALVNARYHERRLYAQIDRIDRSGQKLAADIENLQIELTALRNPARIDAAARRDLKMVPFRPHEALYFTMPAGHAKEAGG